MSAMLELRDVTVSYGPFRAVTGVSLAVPEGAVVALLGPNGAGKSSTLRAVSGLATVAAGEIRFRGGRIDGRSPASIARLGVCHIPEGRGVFPQLTVEQNLTVAARGAPPGWCERALATFPDLAGRMDQFAGTLSGGQQQMLSVARAFVTEAPLLMLDELSLGLAPILVDQLYDAIRLLHERGRTILLVEQYVSRALALADIVYLFAGGRVAFAGQPGELARDGGIAGSYLGGA